MIIIWQNFQSSTCHITGSINYSYCSFKLLFTWYFSRFSLKGILFSSVECIKSTQDLIKLYLHESNRVYRDKMVEEKDFDLFDKIQTEVVKKIFDVSIALKKIFTFEK